jgi:hypothetical protein
VLPSLTLLLLLAYDRVDPVDDTAGSGDVDGDGDDVALRRVEKPVSILRTFENSRTPDSHCSR